MATTDISSRAVEDLKAEQVNTKMEETTGTNTPSMSAEEEKLPKSQDVPLTTPAAPPSGMPHQPNGGLHAWLQVIGGFFIYFNTWGLIITFGVFQSYYQNHLLSHYSPSSISWIGTLQSFLLVEVGIFSGPLYDHGHLRLLIAVGACFLVLGIMMTSLAKDYYSILLSLGVCTGLGMGMLFFPGITAISTYFTTKRGLANGVAASGSALGAVIYPIVLRELITRVSFPWAVRAVGFIVLATLLIPIMIMKPLFLPQGKRQLTDKTMFKDRVFMLFAITNFIGWLGVQIPLFYAALFAEYVIGRPQDNAFYMLAIMGAGSLPGRLLAPLAGDRFSPLWVYPVVMALAGILTLVWIGVTTYGGLIVVALLYGFAYGGVVSLPPPAVAVLTTDVRTLGTRIGTAFSLAGVSALVGPPIAGAIERSPSSFKGVFAFSGAMMMGGSLCLFYVGYLHHQEVRRSRV
ncbi:Riboflavin transporter MCH5 [Cytospora mali]|uniref:Riboflavin transporter MCH5 n=1 Tax=Cytospora mali TaxID=578113 RepID=A0A194UMP5_CYTMA|nr:Riboflavin transporter MCH5 [Valsa mali var. pyri (nom. inval.)]